MGGVSLARSGGHQAEFAGRRVCPEAADLKHYPIRSSEQGARKVLTERVPRFDPVERAMSWHVQYDRPGPDTSVGPRSADAPGVASLKRGRAKDKHNAIGGIGSGVYGPNGGLYGWLESYGSLTLTDSSPVQTFVEPFMLDEMKSFLKMPARSPTDPEEDDLITDTDLCRARPGRVYAGPGPVQKQWDLSLDFWLDYFIKLRAPWCRWTVHASDNTGWQSPHWLRTSISSSIRKRVRALVTPPYNSMWPVFTPWPSSAILIRYTCGFANWLCVLAGRREGGRRPG